MCAAFHQPMNNWLSKYRTQQFPISTDRRVWQLTGFHEWYHKNGQLQNWKISKLTDFVKQISIEVIDPHKSKFCYNLELSSLRYCHFGIFVFKKICWVRLSTKLGPVATQLIPFHQQRYHHAELSSAMLNYERRSFVVAHIVVLEMDVYILSPCLLRPIQTS